MVPSGSAPHVSSLTAAQAQGALRAGAMSFLLVSPVPVTALGVEWSG